MSTSFLKDAESLVMELLAIPGMSGQEGEVVRFLAQRLGQAGAPADAIRSDRPLRSSPIRGEAGNLVLRLPGTQPGKRRLLVAHMDTVPLCQGPADPSWAARRPGRQTNRPGRRRSGRNGRAAVGRLGNPAANCRTRP